jgi:hypothetical protein
MKLSQFKKGKKFWMSGQQWICTDIGTRIVTAICIGTDGTVEITTCELLDNGKRVETVNKEPYKDWMKGPPYAIAETIIDEYDQEACFVRKPKE